MGTEEMLTLMERHYVKGMTNKSTPELSDMNTSSI